ncbi:MAG: PEGA domain-containing protein, partial [Planctomycetaceae bacterium]|nr:PEGA domain-containing protein [Planctomycetaceae bacterium]
MSLKNTENGFMILLVVSGLTLASLTGCVQRRFIVRSQPEGALVTIDRKSIGLTPLSVPFTY